MGLQPEWMHRSTVLKGAVLGLVIQRPGHTYELASRLSGRLGAPYRISSGDLYRPLEALEKAELVKGEVVASDVPTTNRRVYSATEKSEPAFAEWISATTAMAPMRMEFHTKLSVARVQDIPSLLEGLEVYERECRLLAVTTEGEMPPTESLLGIEMNIARKSALRHLRAELEGFVEARRMLNEFMSGQ